MYNLKLILWQVLALYSTAVTRKPLDWLENVFFSEISGSKWVKKQRNTVYIKHTCTHCLHLAKAIRGRQCGYSIYLKIFNREMKEIYNIKQSL